MKGTKMRALLTVAGTPATKSMVIKEVAKSLGFAALGSAINYVTIKLLVTGAIHNMEKNYYKSIIKTLK